eukprot:7149908-Prymnesium_polylepis.1
MAASAPPLRCQHGCGRHGNCDEVHERCICQASWGVGHCQKQLYPACSIGEQCEPQIRIPCAGLRKISPVACECIEQCLLGGEEVCGHASAGCNDRWNPMWNLPHKATRAWSLTVRATFWQTCIAYPPGVPIHSPGRRRTLRTAHA